MSEMVLFLIALALGQIFILADQYFSHHNRSVKEMAKCLICKSVSLALIFISLVVLMTFVIVP